MGHDGDVAALRARLESLDRERAAVAEALRAAETAADPSDRQSALSRAEKVRVFRSLFRGRDDVFPLRWENRSGRSGYSPACRNEWVGGVCEKPRVRCGDCANQAFIAVSDAVVIAHLEGRCVAGVYPLLADNTCWFCAIDLDGTAWREDVAAVRDAAATLGVPLAIERSRSGDGAHAWTFDAAPVAAATARAVASLVLTDATARRPAIGLTSYDRLFPSQDVLPVGGFGNLIALPLQHAARRHGNSVFLDGHLDPAADQWALLSRIERLDPAIAEAIVTAAARRRGGVLGTGADDPEDAGTPPWRPRPSELPLSGPLPDQLSVTVAQQLYIERDGLTPGLFDRLRRLAAFANPVFHERQRLRLPVGRTPRLIACAEEHPRHLALPRGCLDDLRELLDTTPIRLELDDHRTAGDPLETTFTGTLGSEQSAAVDALAGHDTGVLVAPPGSGKTVVAAALIARRRRTTLVIVSSRALVAQWQARLTTFLDIDPADIGTIVGGRRRPTGRIDIATVQTLARDPDLDATLAPYGHVIVDECHHVPAISTEHVLRRAPARYVLGLTATPRRRDGHHPIIRMQCGPTRHRITTRPELRLTVTTHAAPPPTDPASPDATIQTIYASLAHHAARNELIARHALEALTAGRSPLILAGRLDHLQTLQALLEPHVPDLVVLHGRQRPAERRAALAGLAADRPVLVLAIGRFLGEGFDHPRLDTLFLALPVAWSGTLTQYAGRLHRPAPGKRAAEIHDYLDATIPVLERMWHKRARAYRSLGYTIATSTDTQTRDSPHSR